MALSFEKPAFIQHYEKKPAFRQCSIAAHYKKEADKKTRL